MSELKELGRWFGNSIRGTMGTRCIVASGADREKQPFTIRRDSMYDPILHVVLYEPEIPPNTGNIGRMCVATGIKMWLVEPLGFSVADRDLKRAGMDYWQYLNWEVVPDWSVLLEKLAPRRFWYLTKRSTRSYTSVSFEPDDVLVFGRESSGLPPELLAAHADHTLSIPMRTDVRSLNLSSSAAVVAYEAIRQLSDRGLYNLPIGESPIG